MRDKNQWILRLVCLLLIAAMGAAYQTKALAWQQLRMENQEELASAEEHNAQVRKEEARRAHAADAPISSEETLTGTLRLYQDGSFTGTGAGFGGDIVVTLELSEDEITGITVMEASGEDSVYLASAEAIIEDILSAQSAEVDTISGATFSSTGIRDAVRDALEQARIKG